MEKLERLVRTWVATGRDQALEETVSEISQGNATLLQAVKALGEYLTSEDDDLRTKGVDFLSLLLARCPSEKLTLQVVRVLVTFFRGKLEDTETIVPALKGIVVLVSQDTFTSVDATEVARAMFTHVKMRALVQSVRYSVFTIMDTLVARHRDALKQMGKEFLSGYIGLAEGEKDPRNLLVAFAIARVLAIEFDISAHIEDLFNITFCYFPITFRPPPDDPYGISTEDLKKALLIALNATPAFGPLAIPLFIEKLTAGSPVTKRDTLRTLDVCLPVYGASTARAHARKLWSSLKLEIFQPTDVETEAEALKTSQVLIQTIHSDEGLREAEHSAPSENIEGFAKDACEECIRILKEPEKSQAKPAIKVLCAFMSTTPFVARYTLSQAVPHLVKLFLDPDEASNRTPITQLLSDLIAAARDSVTSDPEVLISEEDIPLSPYKDEVLGILTVGLKNPSSCRPALEGLKGLVTTRALLSDEELGFIVHNVNEVLSKDEEESDDVSDAILDLLSSISSSAPRHVSQTTLPLLFTSLPDSAPPRTADAVRLKNWRTLSFLQRLCTQADLFDMLVVRLSTKLDLICDSAAKSHEPQADQEPNAAYAHSVLRTLADVLAVKVDLGHVDVPKYADRLIPRLYNLHIYYALVSDGSYTVATDPRLVAVSSEIITLIVQTLPAQRQETLIASLFAAYMDGDVKRIAEGQQKIPADRKFDPFDSEVGRLQRNLVLMFAAAIIALRREVSLPVADEATLLLKMLHWSVEQAENVMQREAIIQALASTINKRADTFSTFLSDNLAEFWPSQVADVSISAEKRRKAITAWAWMTRALLVRNHDLSMNYTDRLFELFDDPQVSWDAARAIGKIVSADKVLTKANHAVVKFLYAQRFCSTILPRIIEGAKVSNDTQRQNAFLVALTSLIKSVPKTAYAHEMPTLMPLLLRGLDLPDTEIRANVIDTLLAVADSGSKETSAVSEHASSLVSTMLRNSMFREMPSVRVRTAALRYLAILPSLVRYDVLHPQKATVIRELAKVLDDPKRSVRKEAVEARTNWFKFSG